MHHCLINLIQLQNLTTVYMCLNFLENILIADNHSSGKWSKFIKKTMSAQTFLTKQKKLAFISLYLSSFLWVSIVCTFKLIDVLEKHASFILNLATKYILEIEIPCILYIYWTERVILKYLIITLWLWTQMCS